MYSQQEKSALKQQFWTVFGQYMSPIPSSENVKINWVNYKTGVKNLYFRMEAGATAASIKILITDADVSRQLVLFNLFKQLQQALHTALGEKWHWAPQTVDEDGKTITVIYTTLQDVSIYKKEDWPLIISFFKPRIIALDVFWNEVKFGFQL